jgi:hypothetical protein
MSLSGSPVSLAPAPRPAGGGRPQHAAPIARVRAAYIADTVRTDARAMMQSAQSLADTGELARAARVLTAVAAAYELLAKDEALAAYRALCGVYGYSVEVLP